jgi:hypothetical protein
MKKKIIIKIKELYKYNISLFHFSNTLGNTLYKLCVFSVIYVVELVILLNINATFSPVIIF